MADIQNEHLLFFSSVDAAHIQAWHLPSKCASGAQETSPPRSPSTFHYAVSAQQKI